MILKRVPKIYIVILLFLVPILIGTRYFINNKAVDFNADVKPLINKKCISCHGGVKRQSGFSLLFRQEALAINKSGKVAIIPGDAENSEMIKRLYLTDPEERMPYKHPPLSKDEISILKKWINQGAKWGDHWAYVAVEETPIPSVGVGPFGWFGKPSWIKNNIDPFIYKKIKAEGLTPAAIADKPTLLRRVSFDIIGMPAPEAIANKYLQNNNEDAYEILVNELLATPQYGEKWAGLWMDMARYADTKGFEKDDSRTIWRYRDWLINAFNIDKPYNVFLTEQLAGDLLPNPTDAQYIATAFHRNTLTNDEGGTDNEEFRTAAVIDRVNTTWVSLMGTTFACVQCHSHPYDPFKHEEYYKFLALFNNTRDEDTYAEYPFLKEFHNTDSIRLFQLQDWLHKNAPTREKDLMRFIKTGQTAINSLVADQISNGALADTKWLMLRNKGEARIKDIDLTGSTLLYYKYKSWKPGGKWEIHLDSAKGPLLKNIIVDYPYFQSARALYLKGLKNQESFKYNNELKITAAFTSDRSVLFDFITSILFKKNSNIHKQISKKIAQQDVFDHLEISSNIEQELSIGKPIHFSKNETHSFQEWLKISTKTPIKRKDSITNTEDVDKAFLINRFIENNPKISSVKMDEKTIISIPDNKTNNFLMTETLAKVYLEQKKFSSAIKAYDILSLKYPEKSGFFADQIKKIKILQNIKS